MTNLHEYKMTLLSNHGIAIMPTIEHHVARYTWMTNELVQVMLILCLL
jgi:hypothetical protein